MSAEDRGFRALCAEKLSAVTGLEERTAAKIVLGVMVAGVLIPIGVVAWVFYRGRQLEREHGPEKGPNEADMARLREAGAAGPGGLAVEALAQSKNRKTMWTPLGPVPNIGSRLLPSAESMRGMSAAMSMRTPNPEL